MADSDQLTLVANMTASYLRRNSISVDQIGTVVSAVTDALDKASKKLAGITADDAEQPAPVGEKQRPAVPIKKSVQPEHIDQLDGPVSDRIELLRQDCPAAWHIAEALTLPFPALVIAGDMYVKAHIRAELEEQVLDLRIGRGGRPSLDSLPAREPELAECRVAGVSSLCACSLTHAHGSQQ